MLRYLGPNVRTSTATGRLKKKSLRHSRQHICGSTVGVLKVCIFKTLRYGRTIETRKRITSHTYSVSGCAGIGSNVVFVVNRKKRNKLKKSKLYSGKQSRHSRYGHGMVHSTYFHFSIQLDTENSALDTGAFLCHFFT